MNTERSIPITLTSPSRITSAELRPFIKAVSHGLEADRLVTVRKAAEWTFVWWDGELTLVGSGEPVEHEFGASELMRLYDWLRQADWLQAFQYSTAPETDPEFDAAARAFPRHLLRLLAEFGAIDVAVDVEDLPVSEMREAVFPDGEEAPTLPPAGPGIRIDSDHLLGQLFLLRRAATLGEWLRSGDHERILTDLEPWFEELGDAERWNDAQRDLIAIEAARYLASCWFIVNFIIADIRAITLPEYARPARLAYHPATALQSMWVAIAMAADAVAPDMEIPGVFTCDYPPCGITFMRTRTRVRGKYRFCTEAHGRRFHAAASTKKRRAADKTEREERKRRAQRKKGKGR